VKTKPGASSHASLRTTLVVPVLLSLTGCGDYDPPVQGDHASEKYKSDLEACRTTSSHAVYLKNAATPGTWIISPITGPPAVRASIRTCMQGKGYVLAGPG
jgi:predicted small lipoprotein YifL